MSLQLTEEPNEGIFAVEMSGKISDRDFQRLEPAFSKFVAEHGKPRVLLRMHDFHGWRGDAIWDEITFDLKHLRDMDKLAVVGDKEWEKLLTVISRPFTCAQVRYFDSSAIGEARSWLKM